MTSPDTIVSAVAYLCNDAELLHDFVARATAVLEASCDHFELILLDDHSTDRTPHGVQGLLEQYAGLRYIRLARRSGEEVAATAGLDAAIGDYVVVMRARFDPPEAIADMLELAVREGGSVLGVTGSPPNQGWLFRACRRLFYRTAGLLLRARIPADSTGFCVLSRAVVNTIARTRAKSRHLRLLACTLGYPVALYPYESARPLPEQRRRPLRDAVPDALRLLVSSSQTPLRLVSALGILAGTLNLCYVFYVLAIYFFKKEVAPGWVTLSLQLAAMFFFVFLILVSLSEYVVQILTESQDNPLYHVESDRTSAITAGVGRRNVLTDSMMPADNPKKTMKPLDGSWRARGWAVPDFTLIEWGERRSAFALCVFVLNEGERIRAQLERMKPLVKQVDSVIADGGSTDGAVAPDLLARHGARALLTKRGPGKLSAQMRMALAYTLERGYEGVVVMDGNNKDDPAAAPSFLQLLTVGYDHIQGSRYVPGGRAINTPWSRHLAVKYLHAPLLSLAAGFRFTDTTNGFRAYSRRLLLDERIAPFRDVFSGYELHYYLAIRAARLGFHVCETPVTRAYPLGQMPTKIRGVRGNLLILRTLWKACRHQYDPPAPSPQSSPLAA